ncbi:sigma-54 dependent transcriptional regulator [Desulfuromonas carbonis]|uniref:sigma-54 dependent transcriptional regulator n=1 Tax=Desulfuromonas sp. DDH964 TaxID=1823759 RepID=UPI00078B4362|nr:sigma-54 dependent transcriptional regulator [Desulfuromonas sp. DDH964]AMV72844.1 sigma-54-dependent transcriptional response regulator [Desulfuromonas sp. DDH964]
MLEALRSVLLAESNQQDREELAGMIRKEIDCVVYEADNSAEALNILANETVCVLVIGILPPDQDETNLLKTVLRQYSQVLVIPVVPLGNQEAIVAALKVGCFTYLNHPYHFTEGVIAVARALYFYDLLIHQEKRGPKIRKTDGFYGMIGDSPKMHVVYQLIEKVAEDGLSTVLIQGESGTGKELVARAIHAHSRRRLKNFVPVNCAAIPEDLLESELFGHHKGAFTGAIQSKIGRIQYAEGGTLFLDEIGDMSPSLQAKLLRVVQEKSFVPIGGLEQVPVDVRIIAATHRDLEAMVADGDFREDLFYRLSVVPLSLPPLRERREDIPLLVEKFVQIFNRNRPNRLQEIKPAALAALVEYPWPGNVRELENLVQRLVVLHGGRSIGVAELPDKYSPSRQSDSPPNTQTTTAVLAHPFGPEGVDFDALVQDFEDRLILHALQLSNGNKKEAARLLRLNRTTLLAKMNKKGLR